MQILDFPELIQVYEWDCGASALQSILKYYGIEVKEGAIIKQGKITPEEGTLIKEIKNTFQKFKLKFVFKKMSILDLKNYIDKKFPVMILLQAWSDKKTDYGHSFKNGHWVVVIGYDKNKIIFEDPYTLQKTFLTKKELAERWYGSEGKKKFISYGIAVFGEKNHNSKKIVHMD